ncbi:MAG: hypothetical protein O2973_13890 [Gemmatimonadetes bacterium]|nr:hypothetical protein [Gemmatimonadota bacterium]
MVPLALMGGAMLVVSCRDVADTQGMRILAVVLLLAARSTPSAPTRNAAPLELLIAGQSNGV